MNGFLVTGAAGFVGSNLVRHLLRGGHRVAGVVRFRALPPELSAVPTVTLDVRCDAATLEVVAEFRPEVVIHVAGNKDVRQCESNPGEAFATNAVGTGHVARACRKVGAKLVYLSTDLVFDGLRGNYLEEEIPQPTLVYGASKLAGEVAALRNCPGALVCRSGGLDGWRSPLLRWVAAELAAGRSVEAFVDVVNSPTFSGALAEAIEAAIERDLSGVLHVVGADRVSRYEQFRAFAEAFGFDPSLLVARVAGDRRREMMLLPDVSLSTTASTGRIGLQPTPLASGMARLRLEGL